VEEPTPTPSRRKRTLDQIEAEPKPARQRVTGSRDELIERKRLAGAGRREEAGTAFGARWLPEHREQLRLDIAEHGLDGGIAVFLERYPFRTDAGCRYQVAKHGLVTK